MVNLCCCFCRSELWMNAPLYVSNMMLTACYLCALGRSIKCVGPFYGIPADYLGELLRAAGDEWLREYGGIQAAKALPQPIWEAIEEWL